MLANYRKLLVAVIGVVLIAVDQFTGFSLGFGAEEVMNVLIPILTAVGVWAVPNTPAVPAE